MKQNPYLFLFLCISFGNACSEKTHTDDVTSDNPTEIPENVSDEETDNNETSEPSSDTGTNSQDTEDENDDDIDSGEDSEQDTNEEESDTNTISVFPTNLPSPLPLSGTSGPLNLEANVTATGEVHQITVALDLTHSCTKDLSLTLLSPSGTAVLLFDLDGYPVCSSDMESTVFADDAGTPIQNGSNPFQGTFRPMKPLSTFNGEDLSGTWSIAFQDSTVGDFGSVRSISIDIEYQ